MDPVTIITAFSAATALAKALLPQIQSLVQSGEVSPEQQALLLKQYRELAEHAKFTGPEWEVRPAA